MTSFQLVIIVLTGFSAVFWLLQLVGALLAVKTMPLLEKLPDRVLGTVTHDLMMLSEPKAFMVCMKIL